MATLVRLPLPDLTLRGRSALDELVSMLAVSLDCLLIFNFYKKPSFFYFQVAATPPLLPIVTLEINRAGITFENQNLSEIACT